MPALRARCARVRRGVRADQPRRRRDHRDRRPASHAVRGRAHALRRSRCAPRWTAPACATPPTPRRARMSLRAANGVDLLLAEATLPEEYAGAAPHLTAARGGRSSPKTPARAPSRWCTSGPRNDRDLMAQARLGGVRRTGRRRPGVRRIRHHAGQWKGRLNDRTFRRPRGRRSASGSRHAPLSQARDGKLHLRTR